MHKIKDSFGVVKLNPNFDLNQKLKFCCACF